MDSLILFCLELEFAEIFCALQPYNLRPSSDLLTNMATTPCRLTYMRTADCHHRTVYPDIMTRKVQLS